MFEELEFGPTEYEIGRSRVKHSYREHWIKTVHSVDARCGISGEIKFTKTFGISEREMESLEGSVGSSLGVEGLAALTSCVKGSIGQEFEFSVVSSVELSLHCPAAECGSIDYGLYEKVRDHRFEFERPGWFFGTKTSLETPREYVGEHKFDVKRFEDDPACPCPPRKDLLAGGVAKVEANRLLIFLPFSVALDGTMTIEIGAEKFVVDGGLVRVPPSSLPTGWLELGEVSSDKEFLELPTELEMQHDVAEHLGALTTATIGSFDDPTRAVVTSEPLPLGAGVNRNKTANDTDEAGG